MKKQSAVSQNFFTVKGEAFFRSALISGKLLLFRCRRLRAIPAITAILLCSFVSFVVKVFAFSDLRSSALIGGKLLCHLLVCLGAVSAPVSMPCQPGFSPWFCSSSHFLSGAK